MSNTVLDTPDRNAHAVLKLVGLNIRIVPNKYEFCTGRFDKSPVIAPASESPAQDRANNDREKNSFTN